MKISVTKSPELQLLLLPLMALGLSMASAGAERGQATGIHRAQKPWWIMEICDENFHNEKKTLPLIALGLSMASAWAERGQAMGIHRAQKPWWITETWDENFSNQNKQLLPTSTYRAWAVSGERLGWKGPCYGDSSCPEAMMENRNMWWKLPKPSNYKKKLLLPLSLASAWAEKGQAMGIHRAQKPWWIMEVCDENFCNQKNYF